MPKLLISIAEAGATLGISRTSVYALLGQGSLTSVMLGRRRLITAASIADLVNGAAAGAKSPTGDGCDTFVNRGAPGAKP